MPNHQLAELQRRLQPTRQRLLQHPVYRSLTGLEDLQVFMTHHVFAVWDFMSLLKALQRGLTCVDHVWLPRGEPETRRLINEIVLGEESDQVSSGATSHFEMYLAAMRQLGCSTAAIDSVLDRVRTSESVTAALAGAPAPARQFSTTTFSVVQSGSLPAIAAAFTFGREEVIPAMFVELIDDLQQRGIANTSILREYLARHIELDGDEHGPMAERMLCEVCGDNEGRWAAAGQAAEVSLRARIALWDGVVHALPSREAAASR